MKTEKQLKQLAQGFRIALRSYVTDEQTKRVLIAQLALVEWMLDNENSYRQPRNNI